MGRSRQVWPIWATNFSFRGKVALMSISSHKMASRYPKRPTRALPSALNLNQYFFDTWTRSLILNPFNSRGFSIVPMYTNLMCITGFSGLFSCVGTNRTDCEPSWSLLIVFMGVYLNPWIECISCCKHLWHSRYTANRGRGRLEGEGKRKGWTQAINQNRWVNWRVRTFWGS